MFTVEYAKNPVWNDADHTSILLTVKFVEFEEEMPFTATANDPMPYGRELFARASGNEFRIPAPYVASSTATEPQPTTTGSQTL
jgi:hypothetical protein